MAEQQINLRVSRLTRTTSLYLTFTEVPNKNEIQPIEKLAQFPGYSMQVLPSDKEYLLSVPDTRLPVVKGMISALNTIFSSMGIKVAAPTLSELMIEMS
jgi:hypothetical protein